MLRITESLDVSNVNPDPPINDQGGGMLKLAEMIDRRRLPYRISNQATQPLKPLVDDQGGGALKFTRMIDRRRLASRVDNQTSPFLKPLANDRDSSSLKLTGMIDWGRSLSKTNHQTNELPDDPVAFEEVETGPSVEAPQSGDATTPKGDESVAWTVPPIRWGGSVSLASNKVSGEVDESTNLSEIFSIRGASYIYQPWYAQVSGSVDILNTKSHSFTKESREENDSSGTALNVGARLNLFPQSRFPFSAYLEKNDSRADSNSLGTQYTFTRFGANQSWRPELSNENLFANFDHSVVATKDVRSTVSALGGNYSNSTEGHTYNSTARYSRNQGDAGGQGSTLLNLTGSHTWSNPDEGLNVSTFANVSDNQIRLLTGQSLSTFGNQLFQIGSSATWEPDEDLPLIINGGANVINSNTVTNLDTLNYWNFNGFANTQYRFTNNLSVSGGFSLIHTRSADLAVYGLSLNSALSYAGDPVMFGNTVYNWGSGLGVSSQAVSNGARSVFASSSAQHGLTHSIGLAENSTLSLSATQGLSLSQGSTSGAGGGSNTGRSISHSLGASWYQSNGEGITSNVSTSLNDTVGVADTFSRFRSFFMQGSVQAQLTRRSSLAGNLNFGASQNLSEPEPNTSFNVLNPTSPTAANTTPLWSGGGGLSYMHRNPFGVANLFYTVSIQNNFNQTNMRVVSGDPNALSWQTGALFQQSVEYRLGRLQFRGSNTVTSSNGVKNVSIYGTVVRNFGEY